MRLLTLLAVFLLVAAPLGAATTRNDDSCDIGLFPAATLLIPFFEVDIAHPSGSGEHTVFTVTNTGAVPQAARVTLWTDYAYPVISFDLYLTGYDVESISLYNVIQRGLLGPEGSGLPDNGSLSAADNLQLEESTCANLPRQLPAALVTRMQNAFTLGRVPGAGGPACNGAGGVHTYATGYVTIDVVGACTSNLPTDRDYFTHEIRFDNVLIGDYVQVNGDQNFAQANPMVHIRAIPEGGRVATRNRTNLPRTFYSRLHRGTNTTIDARQPLPSTFGARWIEGTFAGFETLYKIWRESAAGPDAACVEYSQLIEYDVVRFDEDENPEVFEPGLGDPPLPFPGLLLPAAAMVNVSDGSQFPRHTNGAGAGWMYLDLQDPSRDVPAQNWVTVTMRSEGRFSADLDAVAFGNGCTPVVPVTPIGPARDTN